MVNTLDGYSKSTGRWPGPERASREQVDNTSPTISKSPLDDPDTFKLPSWPGKRQDEFKDSGKEDMAEANGVGGGTEAKVEFQGREMIVTAPLEDEADVGAQGGRTALQAPPSTDPIILELARRGKDDSQLRDLMKKVAQGDATKPEQERFQVIIDDIKAENKRNGVPARATEGL